MMLESSPFGFNNFSFTPTESFNSPGSNSASSLSFPVLIYEGSINYWRTRETIYLSIYEHQKVSSVVPHPEVSVCIEVVAFHPKIGKEAPHIYLSSSLLYDKFLRNEFEENKLREEDSSQSSKKTNIVKCNNKFTQECIRNYVLSRVGVLPATTSLLASSSVLDQSLSQSDSTELEEKGPFVFTIGFTPQLSDSDDGLVILESKPPHLGELPINSQARKEAEMLKKNFDTEMKLLRLETSIISEDCNKAEKMSDLAMNTINLIEEMDAHLNEKEDMSYDSDTSSRAKKRWIGAIKRVLCKNKQSKSTENIDENDDKSNAKNFPFKIPAQNRKKSFGVKKDVPSDIQNKIPLKCEGVVRRNSKEFNDEKEMDSNEARRERMENFYFAPKSPPKKRNSLNPADDVIVRAHVKDSMFSNLSRVRRVTAGDVSSHIIAAVGVREMKEVKEKICIPRHSIAAPQTPVRNRVDGAVSVAGAGDIPQIGGRGKVRRTPATPEIEHINRVRKAAGVLPRLSLNPADKLIVNPYGGMPVPTLPSISFSNMRSAS